MKKIIMVVVLGWFTFVFAAEYKTEDVFVPIVVDDITVIVKTQKKVCKRRPRLTSGSYLEKFFNIENLKVGDNWYFDGCEWQKTTKRCDFKYDDNDQINGDSIKPSSLKGHISYVRDAEVGLGLLSCQQNINYDFGDGFEQYNDYFFVDVLGNTQELGLEVLYFADSSQSDHIWWIGTWEALSKSKYPFTW